MPSAATPEKLDGRRLRSEQSREAIVEAMLALLRDGHRPGAQEIARRAGVSLRSVFRHFEDLDGLFSIATALQRQRTRHLFDLPPPSGTLAERVAALVAHRARLYEEISPTRRIAVSQAPFHAPLRQGLSEAATMLRRHLPLVFSLELARLTPSQRRAKLDALEAASSWGFWDTLRSEQRLSVDRSKSVMAATLLALATAVSR